MARVLYLSHPEVAVDPSVPVPDWGLSPVGRSRAVAFAASPLLAGTARIVASRERKAIETAEIIGSALGLAVDIRGDLHENDRCSTGFLPAAEFEATADCFFAEPETSIRGWERAIDAQRRIVRAVTSVLAEEPEGPPTLFVGHGGVGTLLLCHAGGLPIDRRHDQKAGGGNVFLFEYPPFRLVAPWQPIEMAASMTAADAANLWPGWSRA